jgi:hypothetical protein
MKARQVCMYLEDGLAIIAAIPAVRNLLAGDPVETIGGYTQARVIKHTKGAHGE